MKPGERWGAFLKFQRAVISTVIQPPKLLFQNYSTYFQSLFLKSEECVSEKGNGVDTRDNGLVRFSVFYCVRILYCYNVVTHLCCCMSEINI